ncbi:Fc.00g023000.m01.CDS01 [Cosmosporella sp. VM-42]
MELLAMILIRAKENAEAYLGSPVHSVVLGVPVLCPIYQRCALIEAAFVAGLRIKGLLVETSAIAYTCALTWGRGWKRRKTVLIFDLGAEGVNTAIVEIQGGVTDIKSVSGRRQVGGQYFISRVVEEKRAEIMQKWNKDILDDWRALQRLRQACQRAVWKLSVAEEAHIDLRCLLDGRDFQSSITRPVFETLCAGLIERILYSVKEVLNNAYITHLAVDHIFLSGGASRIPAVQSALSNFFVASELLPWTPKSELATVKGLAYRAVLHPDMYPKVSLNDITPISINLRVSEQRNPRILDPDTWSSKNVVKHNSAYPVKETTSFDLRDDSEVVVFEGVGNDGIVLATFTPKQPSNWRSTSAHCTIEFEPRLLRGKCTIKHNDGLRLETVLSKMYFRPEKNLEDAREKVRQYQLEVGPQEQDAEKEVIRNDVCSLLQSLPQVLENLSPVAGFGGEEVISELQALVENTRTCVNQSPPADSLEFAKRRRELLNILNDPNQAQQSIYLRAQTRVLADQVSDSLLSIPRHPSTATYRRGVSSIRTRLEMDILDPPQSYDYDISWLEAVKEYLAAAFDATGPQSASNRQRSVQSPPWLEETYNKDGDGETVIPYGTKTRGKSRTTSRETQPAHESRRTETVSPIGEKEMTHEARPASDQVPVFLPSSIGLSTNRANQLFHGGKEDEKRDSYKFSTPSSSQTPIVIRERQPAPENKAAGGKHTPLIEDPAQSHSEDKHRKLDDSSSTAGAFTPSALKAVVSEGPAAAKATEESRGTPAMDVQALPDPKEDHQGLGHLFASFGASNSPTDAHFEQISTFLKSTGLTAQSETPRLYTVLRLINRLDMMEAFIDKGITDMWFPFTNATFPPSLRPSTRAQFLETQSVVFSKGFKLEKGSARKHCHFNQDETLPFKSIAILGKGAHGVVDKVMSTISHQEYARKLFRRVKGMRPADVKTFTTELAILKRVQHKHCVELAGSYSDPRYFALLMEPVGDCNLAAYYDEAKNNTDKLSLLRSFFGCLAGAVQDLHNRQIRHRDIKPQNIIVKGNLVLLTDFGIAFSWENLTRGTTTADSGKTLTYAAPEVVRVEARNESADTWSLGCVFLEMLTVLKGKTVEEMRSFFLKRNDNYHFYANVDGVVAWADRLQSIAPETDNAVLGWVKSMLQPDPTARPTAAQLVEEIIAASERDNVLFTGLCCQHEISSATDEDDDGHVWNEDSD